MGRPPAEVSEKVVAGMASVGATNTEIAEFCGVSVDTITRRFADILAKGRADMRIKLRRMQWSAAKKGNTAMLVWLGKNTLGQLDAPTTDNGSSRETAEIVRDAVREILDADGLRAA